MFRKKTVRIQVSTYHTEFEFPFKANVKGREIFEATCKTIGLRETWYFGLQYDSANDISQWLDNEKRILKQIKKNKQGVYRLHLRLKFYPEDIEEEILQEVTQHLIFLQVKKSILNMEIYCPAEASVLLASYGLQAEHGDYVEEAHPPGFSATERLLPQRVMDQYQLTLEMWEERILAWYADHYGLSRFEAELEYLKIAQDLEMYGISYFEIKNKKQTELFLGIHSTGISVYDQGNKLIPQVSFQWSETRHISFVNKKFIILPVDRKSHNFQFVSPDGKVNRQILDLCVGNHDLFMRRRKPDTVEVTEMKLQAKEEKKRREQERTRFWRERQAREQAQLEKDNLQKQLEQYQDELEKARVALERSEEATDLLAEKARVASEESSLWLHKAGDLEDEIKRLSVAVNQREEEKAMMEDKMVDAEGMIFRVLKDSELRAHESAVLRQELDRARQSEKLAKQKLLEIATAQQTMYREVREGDVSMLLHGSTDNVALVSREMHRENAEYVERSRHLQLQLTNLKSEIEGLKISGTPDLLDQIHMANAENGDSKYMTLKKLQSGTTEARVQFFQKL